MCFFVAKYLSHSRVYRYSRQFAAVAAFGGCQDAQWVGPVDGGDGGRAETSSAAA
jgi:hypothetical protein